MADEIASRCSTSCCRCCGRSASRTSRPTCRRRTPRSTSATTRSGTRPPRRCARRSSTHGLDVHDQGGRRRVLRPEDRHRRAATRSGGRGSCRRSRPTSTCPSASTSSTSAPTTPATGRSCCTAPCSARSSGSSACSSSTTPARSPRGWRRCRCGCCRWPRRTRRTPATVVDRARRPPASGSTSSTADDQLGKRIRTAKLEKIPYVLVVGDDDVAAGTVGVNPRGGEVERGVPLDEFVEQFLRGDRRRRIGRRSTPDACWSASGRGGGRATSPPRPSATATTPTEPGSVFTRLLRSGLPDDRDPHRPPWRHVLRRS